VTPARRPWPDVAALALVLLGAALRLRQWWGGRSLWLDEAFLAGSLTTRGPGGLVTEPLQDAQSAPLGWLLAVRGVLAVAGTSERDLRLVSLLLGLAVLALTWALSRRLLPAWAAPVPVGLVAVHPLLVYYSNELKPYSADVAAFLLLLLLASRVRVGRPPLLLSAVGAVVVWFSTASLLAAAGIGLVLVLDALRAGGPRSAARTAAGLLPWALSAGVAAVAVQRLQASDLLADYWAFSFPRGAADLPAWLVRTGESLTVSPLRLSPAWLVLLLLVAGAALLVRRTARDTALVLAVLAAGVAGAAASAYPLNDRLALWTVPLVVLLVCGSLPDRVGLRALPALAVAGGALAVVVVPAVRDGLPLLVDRQDSQELRPVIEQLAEQLRPADVLLVDRSARAATAYYAERVGGLSPDGLLGFEPAEGPCDDAAVLRAAGFGERTVWVVFSHQSPAGVSRASRVELPRRISALAALDRVLEAPGAAAFRFVPRPGAVDVPADDPSRCLVLLPLED
jgi:hypothetical protein